ncbi:hypothetical protein E3N88_35983 [Mikania micrantha]|uniref:Ribophorin II second domain-containing protein n=1 Tax=Mikania micrantha TaxID=192012 RepID=A0A5N6M590_9ASTR|nr:hypothetical protein E3N88_35983 [Mikania micrantha]
MSFSSEASLFHLLPTSTTSSSRPPTMKIFSYGIGGASTRTKVVGRVYIADVALSDHNISFHHEMYHGLESMYVLAKKCIQLKPTSSSHKLMRLIHGILEENTEVKVNTVLGSTTHPLSVKLMQVFSYGSKNASVLKKELHFDPKEAIYTLDAFPEGVDIGEHVFPFEHHRWLLHACGIGGADCATIQPYKL